MASRPDIGLTPDEQRAWLESGHTMILSTLGHDGYPHSVAMWYVLLDGAICFSTYGKSQKAVNVERHPKVACLLEAGEAYEELRGLMIRGTAVLDADPDLNGRVQLELFKKYVAEPGAAISAEMEELIRQRGRKRAVIKVTADKIASWDHRKA